MITNPKKRKKKPYKIFIFTFIFKICTLYPLSFVLTVKTKHFSLGFPKPVLGESHPKTGVKLKQELVLFLFQWRDQVKSGTSRLKQGSRVLIQQTHSRFGRLFSKLG